ncbi:uncharacterized protein LOC134768401 [Penaeus indicus]|uniref:uncharacterized protein LOC134768401 n=1 Tax=Penaeus indicus TaxID=29960 RepID=UPI00300CA459
MSFSSGSSAFVRPVPWMAERVVFEDSQFGRCLENSKLKIKEVICYIKSNVTEELAGQRREMSGKKCDSPEARMFLRSPERAFEASRHGRSSSFPRDYGESYGLVPDIWGNFGYGLASVQHPRQSTGNRVKPVYTPTWAAGGVDREKGCCTRLFQVFWANGKLPQDFRDANIIHLYENKSDRSCCDNHRGISLLSIAGKILAHTLLNRITKHILDDVVSESQCGFRKQRGTVDMVFAIRQIQEKCVEQHQDLLLLFIDLTEAFDTVNRPALWAILSKLGWPPRFVKIIRSFHDGILGRVIENGDASDPFSVANGVKQGCVLAPTLFSLLFAQMLSAALARTNAGVTVHYRTDGDFFNIRRLKSHSKVRQAVVRDFLFADDCAIAAHSEEDLQELADCFATAAKMFGLTISIKKTEVLRQLAPNTTRPPSNITMDGNALKNVESFKHLGSSINSATNLDDEVLCRISQASRAFGRLHTRIWLERGISTKTKLSVYRAVALPSLLCGCETWTCYRRHIKKIDQFHLRCLRKILRVSWKDREPNQEILRRAGLTGIEAMLSQSPLRWPGHVTRMDDSRLPKQLFHAELSTGKRHRGGQRKRYKDSLKSNLKAYNIPVDGWQAVALDRPKWRAAIREGNEKFENCRLQSLDEKRKARKTRVPDPSTAVSCDLCGKFWSTKLYEDPSGAKDKEAL